MPFLTIFKDFCATNLHIFSWHDCLEIAIISSIVYAFIRWLSHDQQKNLTAWWYGYCLLLFCSSYGGLAIVHLALCCAAPVVVVTFILIHQQTLQKNFITLTALTPRRHPTTDWLETLIQGCLHALNKNREVVCIIERNDALDTFLSANAVFNAEITHELLELLTKHEGAVTLWTTHAGKLHALNPTWRWSTDELWAADEVKTLQTWKQHALLVTSKSDAIMFTLSPATRLCTLITQGKIVNDLTAHQAFALLKTYCTLTKQGDLDGDLTARPHFKQPTSQR